MTPQATDPSAGRPARGTLAGRRPLDGDRADLRRGRRSSGCAARSSRRAHARPARRRAALGAAAAATSRSRALGAMTGGQAVQMVKAGLDAIYLSGWQVAADANLARQHLSRPEPLPGEQRAGARQAAEQRAAARRPDRLVRGPQRHALARADRRRRRGRLRRAAERVRADALDDRGRRRRRALRGPARVREEVRPPRRQGARADGAVRAHAERGAARGRRARRADGARRAHRRALRGAAHERRRRVRPRVRHRRAHRRRASSASATASTRRSPAALAYAPYADLLWFETSTPDLGEAREFAEAIHEQFPGKLLAYNCSPSFNWRAASRRRRDRAASRRSSASWGYRFQFITLAGFHSLNAGDVRARARLRDGGDDRVRRASRSASSRWRSYGYTATRHQREVGAGYFDLVTQAVSPRRARRSRSKGSTEEAQFEARRDARDRRAREDVLTDGGARVRRAPPPRAEPDGGSSCSSGAHERQLELDAGENPRLPAGDARDPRGRLARRARAGRPERPPLRDHRARSSAR